MAYDRILARDDEKVPGSSLEPQNLKKSDPCPKHELYSDVWRYSLESNKWNLIENSGSKKPLLLAGHSLVTVKFKNGTELVISFGGYSTNFGYTSLVQEFRFDHLAKSVGVSVPFTFGRRIPGSYGHVSIVDQSEPSLVYIYAGKVQFF